MVNSWEPLYSENYMKSKKANKKFDFKVFTETGPKTSLITDGTQQNDSDLKNKGGKPTVRVSNVGHALHVWLNGEYHALIVARLPPFLELEKSRSRVNSWEPLYSGNYMKSKKANKKFFKVFTETGPKTSLITDDDNDLKNKGGKPTVRVSNVGHALHVWLNGEYHVFHTWDVDITKRLDYSSAIAVLGFSLIISILRTFDVRVEAARVMVSAPVLALVTTHVLYINFYKLDYVAQLFLWARWAAISWHPSNWKLWAVVIASGLAMLLEIYDFPPYGGYFDAHSIWHLATVPLTIIWWSFIRDDAEFRTSSLLKKSKTKAKFKIDDSDLKNKGGKPTVKVSNVGHALHVWLNGEYHVFHTQDVEITKRLDYSSEIAVLGFSLIVSILRTFDVPVEAARVMVSASVLALVTIHVLYINFYKLDYASGLAMLLEIYDFPPYEGYFDAHSIWHLATVPLTILWWSFIRDDAEFRTSSLLKKSKTKANRFSSQRQLDDGIDQQRDHHHDSGVFQLSDPSSRKHCIALE
ncbi:hypothetical protein F2Q68_00011977 [Brassica cretica]|uniref:Post-GPI attachment to proteins factor 3 n=1 Tax=Brassica cretica TaxID=69181 RepID=A0A8S9KWB9_BRACR|nr:hypothetical protein F2Q68_00011977 [Brassica cretica]